MSLAIFQGVDIPPDMFPHSVAVATAAETADPGFGRIISDAAAGPGLACLITNADPEEIAAAFARESVRISHIIYFPADPGCKPDDVLVPQDDTTVFYRVQSRVNEMRADLIWTVRALEQTSET